jgi:hypothetical protein
LDQLQQRFNLFCFCGFQVHINRTKPAEVLTPQSEAKADISCVDMGENNSDAPTRIITLE